MLKQLLTELSELRGMFNKESEASKNTHALFSQRLVAAETHIGL